MNINFRRISALAASALMLGMTAGVAAAANYPQPFVSGGSANVAIVYGTGSGVSALDKTEAINLQTDLGTSVTGTTGGVVTPSGETVSLDTSADRLWLNTSLSSVKQTITKSDLPTVLADYSFSGDVTSKVTSSIKLQAGAAAGGDNSGKVIFSKQPSSSDDPVIGISMGSSATSNPLYNASATMSAINFTHADSEGEEIVLFGQSFTIAAETDTTNLVLLKDAEKVTLSVPSNPSTTVTVGGETYTVRLITASSSSANVEVTNSAGVSASKEINEAASKKINGLDVAVTTATSSSLESVGESASIILGSEKLTLTSGSVITVGENNDPIDGTLAYIVGGTIAATEIAVTVFRADSTHDVILPGESFEDPVFGSFKIDFAGLSSPLGDSDREVIPITTSGDDTMSIQFTEQGGYDATVDFAHNESDTWRLADDSNFSIGVREMATLSYASGATSYIVLGNEDFGHMLELYDVYNQTTGTSSITNDRVKFRDVFTGENYETTFTSTEASGTIDVDGKRYTVTFSGTGESASVYVKYPTSESADADTFVVYPTIETAMGALVQFYEPLTFSNLSGIDNAGTYATSVTFQFPDGEGYTPAVLTYAGSVGNELWDVTGAATFTLNTSMVNSTTLTIGTVTYNLTSTGAGNDTVIYMINPESSAAQIDNPAVVLWEAKDDDSSKYHAIVVDLEGNAASMGSSTNGVGVNDVLFSSDLYHNSATRASDSDFTEDIDWWGTLVTTDASDSDQKTVTISYPKNQVYASIYVGAADSVVSSGTTGSIGDVLVMDSEASTVSSKNQIIVGGSCINSAAASLVGGAKCGSAWTDATGVGSGQFLIQSFAGTSGKVSLLVAGYASADTVNAATYLRNNVVDTSVGKKYIGTSSTSASLAVA
jgi:hypothetical protein